MIGMFGWRDSRGKTKKKIKKKKRTEILVDHGFCVFDRKRT